MMASCKLKLNFVFVYQRDLAEVLPVAKKEISTNLTAVILIHYCNISREVKKLQKSFKQEKKVFGFFFSLLMKLSCKEQH